MTSAVHFRNATAPAAAAAPAPLAAAPAPLAAAPAAAPARPAVTCGLCGHRFAPDRATMACARCPLARGCAVLCCPRCGYEFVTESRLVNWLRRFFSR